MEEADTENPLTKKPPKVPIQTYRWEDLKRSRLKGGYPWTYLYKEPYDGEPHPEHYTMEEFRRSKSSTTLGRRDTLEIEELANTSSSERGSVDPIITEAATPEPQQKARPRDASIVTLESAESSDNISQYLDKEEKENLAPNPENPEESPTKLLEPEISEQGTSKDEAFRNERAKSEEPKRKRKFSIDSSYSRISLSKLGVMKKLKDAKEKIKVPRLSFRSLRRPKKETKPEEKETKQEEKETIEKPKKAKKKDSLKQAAPEKPVYIHIPLKPPPGETDEFSHLEFEETQTKPRSSTIQERTESSSVPDSPEPTAHDVQFIVLTPPSDDEILEDVQIPETPRGSESFFDPSKIEELKTLAKDAVDDEVKGKKLETVEEGKENENSKEQDAFPQKEEKESESVKEEAMIVDEEDGLRVSGVANVSNDNKKAEVTEEEVKQPADQTVEVSTTVTTTTITESQTIESDQPNDPSSEEKMEEGVADQTQDTSEDSSMKQEKPQSATSSQGAEKRKSFRKKGNKDETERIYEDVQVPKTEAKEAASINKTSDEKTKLQPANISQSMSVDEEKTYLDAKIIKNTSLEEDYNKWSKINDHEYEPVNPPPDDGTLGAPPLVHVTNTSDIEITYPVGTGSVNSSLNSLERRQLGGEINNAHDIQFTVTSPESINDDDKNTSQMDSSTLEDQPTGKKGSGPGKFQQAMRNQAGKFKTKIQNIKKPNISLPSRPKLDKFKIEKPKLNFPKIPDRTVIHLPFTITRKRTTTKRTLRERQLSTESNAGDSKKNIFDFRTYPRIFKKKPKDDLDTTSYKEEHDPTPPIEFATVPRTNHKKAPLNSRWKKAFSSAKKDDSKKPPKDVWGGKDSVRIPLHSEDSVDKEEREESVENETVSHTRFNEDIDIDDAYERENQEIHRASPFSSTQNSRWNHGTFHGEVPEEFQEDFRQPQVTDLDNDISEAQTPPSDSFEINTSKEIHSSGSSLGPHRRGVLEEINSDEFFLRQKGISQDNIDMGMYLSSEIREAFMSPTNALSQMQDDKYYDREYNTQDSNTSYDEKIEKRVPIKKPKRKKTPHVSEEYLQDQNSEFNGPNEYPKQKVIPVAPIRPNRKTKAKKELREEKVIPFQETIPLDSEENLALQRGREALKNAVNSEDFKYIDENNRKSYSDMYENEMMQGIEQPDIHITDPYTESIFKYATYHNQQTAPEEKFGVPEAPPRKHRSLKSLNFSEHDSILGDFPLDKDVLQPEADQQYGGSDVVEEPPIKPRRFRSRTRSQSRATSQPDDDRTSRGAESLTYENQVPCVEETCVQDIRDAMGYAVIDKKLARDPPLPPPRTPPRRRRSIKSISSENKFSTVPRMQDDEKPVRPLRNYSTLGPSRPPRNRSIQNLTDEDKENIDITQYIEIEDEPSSHLQSGEIIQKMRDRPLPPPPRPPRKPRSLHDSTQDDNIFSQSDSQADGTLQLDETEVSTQTEPLPGNYIYDEEDSKQEKSTPSSTRKKRHLETPTQYSYEETVTHGSLIIEPLNGAKLIPDSQLTKVESSGRIIPVQRYTEEDEETSEIPEEFHKLKNPSPQKQESDEPREKSKQKVQLTDLDIDRLTVNELLANKITVSQIDGVIIQVNEISSKSGALKVNEIEIPQSIVDQILQKIQPQAHSTSEEVGTSTLVEPTVSEVSQIAADSVESEQKKTPIESGDLVNQIEPDEIPKRPPRQNSLNKSEEGSVQHYANIEELQNEDLQTPKEEDEAPPRPTRQADPVKSEVEEQIPTDNVPESKSQPPPVLPAATETSPVTNYTHSYPEPEVDDEPPPRPPHPSSDYIPSQPPASFYALRAQKYAEYLDDDIPLPPRRRRHQKATVSKSSSDDTPPAVVSRRRLRTPEPSIPELTGQLVRACGTAADRSFKRLITHITKNILNNEDGQQDMHVMMVILLVLIAGLILLGWGERRTTIHHHHWEFFFPPQDL